MFEESFTVIWRSLYKDCSQPNRCELFSLPEFALEVEIARRRALHHVHDSSRILVDVMHYTDANHRQAYTEIVGALNTIEQRLIDLDPKTAQTKQP